MQKKPESAVKVRFKLKGNRWNLLKAILHPKKDSITLHLYGCKIEKET